MKTEYNRTETVDTGVVGAGISGLAYAHAR